MARRTLLLVATLAVFSWYAPAQVSVESAELLTSSDLDRDGLPDEFEQQLLEKFVPTFFLSNGDCDTMPAEFQPFSLEPKAVAKNGTIYGHVFRHADKSKPFVEVHYFHLWTRDCGRAGHALDTEHVSALITANDIASPAAKWTALYWYAAAHEDTLCDVSTAARASYLEAETHGPPVWISKGKHASFLNRGMCSLGCGGDTCQQMTKMSVTKLINLGELAAPLSGAIWIQSKRWPLALKMGTDFSEAVLVQLNHGKLEGVIALRRELRPTQAVFFAGDSTADALDVSGRKTGFALSSSSESTGRALDTSFTNIEESLARTGKSISSSGSKTTQAIDASARSVGTSMQKTATKVRRALGF